MKNYVELAELLTGETSEIIEEIKQKEFAIRKTPIVVIDIFGDDSDDNDEERGISIAKYYNNTSTPAFIKKISIADIEDYGFEHNIGDCNWTGAAVNKYIAKHCNRNKLFITSWAYNACSM